ncbi:unnamed protein product [Euphydryas editha]|uniref:Uncharacterized protein n=1 Tax=Euphydryas editha TaxID=104508 RepID=A0AAU9UXS3_EUPED|nr:unnamed protein product [Euphydryas editha]
MTILCPEELKTEERQKMECRNEGQEEGKKEGWTCRLIPQEDNWSNRKYGDVNDYLTQMLSGHGCFQAYLHRFKYEDSPECSMCPGIIEDAEHVFSRAPTSTAFKQKI